MPFNFPIEQNRFGDLFAQGIANAISTYRQGQAFQRQRALDTQTRSLQEFSQPGFHFGEAPKTLPTPQVVVDTPDPAQATSFQQQITSAMPKVQGIQPSGVISGQGWYYDPEEAMSRLRPQMLLAAQGEGLKEYAKKNADEPFAVNAFQRGLQGDQYRSNLGYQRGLQEKNDAANALVGAQVPGGSAITAPQARAMAFVPSTAAPLLRPPTMIPGSPEWQRVEQFKSDLVKQRTEDLFVPKTAAALNQKAGELALTPLNPDETAATTQLPRMAQALQILKQLPGPSARQAMTSHGGFWRNYLNTPQGQQWSQAATQAALSGAVATEGNRGAQPERVEYFKNTYIPRAGDSDAVAEQKFQQFQNLIRGVKTKAGRGYDRLDPESRAVVDQFLGGSQPSGGVAAKYGIKPSVP